MYWVADHNDAINANHKTIIPAYAITKNVYEAKTAYDGNMANLGIHIINSNAHKATICNVVFILPIEKRAFGTGISIFCVPKNSRRH